MRLLYLLAVSTYLLVAGCSGIRPAAFEDSKAKPEMQNFFIGHTRSTGVIENRGGRPTARITTETQGILKDGSIYIEQDLNTEGGKRNHRSWQMRQIDAHHIEATANDISGTARGLLYGNVFSWTFTLKLPDRKFIRHVRMSQTMYLMPGGQTMIIRSVIRKAGIVVTQLTEQFRKD